MEGEKRRPGHPLKPTSLSSSLSLFNLHPSLSIASEATKYVFPSRSFQSMSFEEALMSVSDLETVEFLVLKRNQRYEIREVEPYFIAETTMPGKLRGFNVWIPRQVNVQTGFLPLLDGNICSRQLKHYLYHLRNNTHDNGITYWKRSAAEEDNAADSTR